MTQFFWLAMSAAGLGLFSSSQDACASAGKRGLIIIYRIQYSTEIEKATKECCKSFYQWLDNKEECGDHPSRFGCDYSPKITRMKCETTPSYKAVPE